LDNILREFIPTDRLMLLGEIAEKVRQTLLEVGVQIGYLRWINYKENLGLNFESLPIDQLLDRKTRMLDFAHMIRAAKVASKCALLPISDRDIHNKMSNLESQKADPWHICQGHDLVYILEFMLPVVIEESIGRDAAESARKRARSDRLNESLRLAYDKSFFVTTRLFAQIRKWESDNQPFIVLDN
jgi:hypothetical protein